VIDSNPDSTTPPDLPLIPERDHGDDGPSPGRGLPSSPVEDNGRHRNVFDVVRDIKNGVIDTSNISADDRRLCVTQLMGEGLSVGEIAQVLRVSTRTVTRDRQVIHEQNAIEPDPKLGYLLAGRLAAEYEATAARIRRVTRDKETPAAVKIDGEYKCFDMFDRLLHRFQSMGLVPTAAQRVQGDLTHNVGELANIADLRTEVLRLEKIEREAQGVPPAPGAPAPSPSPAPTSSPAIPPASAPPSAAALTFPATPPPKPAPPVPLAPPSATAPPPPLRPKTGIEIYLETEQKRREERCKQ
jgi:hypothetical protein